MRFIFSLLGVELVGFEFTWPARGIYPVPEEIYSEEELDSFFESFKIIDRDEDDQ